MPKHQRLRARDSDGADLSPFRTLSAERDRSDSFPVLAVRCTSYPEQLEPDIESDSTKPKAKSRIRGSFMSKSKLQEMHEELPAELPDLPEEMWLHVLDFLNVKDVHSIGRVNHMFFRLSRDEWYWKLRCLKEAIPTPTTRALKKSHCKSISYRKLFIQNYFRDHISQKHEFTVFKCSNEGMASSWTCRRVMIQGTEIALEKQPPSAGYYATMARTEFKPSFQYLEASKIKDIVLHTKSRHHKPGELVKVNIAYSVFSGTKIIHLATSSFALSAEVSRILWTRAVDARAWKRLKKREDKSLYPRFKL